MRLTVWQVLCHPGLEWNNTDNCGNSFLISGIGVRDGGGQLPPKKITKSKSPANVQHKSGEEWEIKKPKMPKSPQFVGQTKAVGQYSLHSRAILAYYKKNWDKFCQFCG